MTQPTPDELAAFLAQTDALIVAMSASASERLADIAALPSTVADRLPE